MSKAQSKRKKSNAPASTSLNAHHMANGTSEPTQHSNALLQKIADQVADISREIERTQIADYVNMLNKPWTLIKSNIISGIARGVGFAIGFTIFTATIFYILQKLGALNLPIVGDYIAQLVEIVKAQLEGKRF